MVSVQGERSSGVSVSSLPNKILAAPRFYVERRTWFRRRRSPGLSCKWDLHQGGPRGRLPNRREIIQIWLKNLNHLVPLRRARSIWLARKRPSISGSHKKRMIYVANKSFKYIHEGYHNAMWRQDHNVTSFSVSHTCNSLGMGKQTVQLTVSNSTVWDFENPLNEKRRVIKQMLRPHTLTKLKSVSTLTEYGHYLRAGVASNRHVRGDCYKICGFPTKYTSLGGECRVLLWDYWLEIAVLSRTVLFSIVKRFLIEFTI